MNRTLSRYIILKLRVTCLILN